MPEIIQDWLGTKLGVLIDLSPEKFGRNTKNGKLLAQLLYNYGVIPAHILNNVKESKNYYECYNNLVILKPWLKYIGVIHDDSTLQQMACGEGSAAISLFYSVYLNLEKKDRYHYFSKQKERRISDSGCLKFKVDWVPESFISAGSGDSSSKLAAPLFEKADLIEWHKEKCKLIVEQIKKTKERFQKVSKEEPELGPVISKHATSQPLNRRQIEAEETRKDITEFEKKHPYESHNLNFSELTEQQNTKGTQPYFVPSLTEAKSIISGIKRRKKGDIYARNFQEKMQHMLLDEQWKDIVEKQDGTFENEVCKNLLQQSQYEKQMAKKLYLMRNRKKVCVENRKKIECLKIDHRQKEYDEKVQKDMEMRGEYWGEEEIESEKIEELHRRLYDERARMRRQALKAECRKIICAWVEIAIRISEFRELIGCQIPKALMKDLKELFFKDLSVFDILEHFEDIYEQNARTVCRLGGEEEGEAEFENGEFEKMKSEEMDRQSILDECDFSDYLHLMGSWMVELLFPDGTETEVKHLVLGYIVHKLLSMKYPPPNAPVTVSIKSLKPASVVLGLTDEIATNMLIDLMEACKILVVRVDDAINFVLAAYKEELSVVRDIDITFQAITEESLRHKDSDPKEKESRRKLQLLKTEIPEFLLSEDDYGMIDKQTQTPRMIPEDDPLLSPNAELGKLAFEALGGGDPVPDPVIVSAVVAYVVSKQEDYNGWILLNYPLLYSQASELEYSLLGFRTLPPLDDLETLEEVEGFSYRSPWSGAFSRDTFAEYRNSKLVPKPEIFNVSETKRPKTYFDSFIKLRKSPETPHVRHSDESEEFGPLERFYLDLRIFYIFEYQNLNFQMVKNLGRIVLGADDYSDVSGKNSEEVFGSIVMELNEKWEPKRKPAKEMAGGAKKLALEKPPTDIRKEFGKIEDEGEEEKEEAEEEAALSPPQPGDPHWEWVTGPQPEGFLLALASLWENMETVYIEDFKNVFFTLRVHRSNVVNYCGFVRKSLRILMRRPDDKQKILSDFQQSFNEIDEDLRPDVDIKCELHVRVSEVEQVLMNIADERKKNSLKDTTKFAQDGWIPDEMANLVNTYLSALQLEADRCIDSCQVIMDYYTALQQKIPEAKPLPKVPVPRVQFQDRKYSATSSTKPGSPRNSDPKRRSLSEQKASKTRSLADKKKRNSEASLAGAGEFVMDILTRLTLPEDGFTPFHTFFVENVQTVANEVKSTMEGCIYDVRRSDKADMSTTRQTKNSKKPSETNIPPSNENLLAEWTTALENELSRFTFRSHLILARGIFDMNELLTMILNILSSLTEEITEMYYKEIDSIAVCCRVFRCGIEEEVQIEPVLELKEDEFLVHMNNISSHEEDMIKDVEDEERRFRFTVDQLKLLFSKLQRVAPEGEIIKRSLAYIFEDLRVLNLEVENCACFPEVWNHIEPNDVVTILDEVYQDLEIVHWKDFIIYALDIPLPTELDVLSMRAAFREFDPYVTELITRENYDGIQLWFENFSTEEQIRRCLKVKDLLYNMYQVNQLQMNYSALLLAFCKDENPVVGFEKALALAMGKVIEKRQESEKEESMIGESPVYHYGLFSETDRKRSEPFCCPRYTDATSKCIPKDKIVRCECKDELAPELSTDDSAEELNHVESEGEGGRIFFYEQQYGASSIPFHILLSLLKASFPSLPQLSVLLDCQQTFRETLSTIYDSLDSYDGAVEVHKLVKHEFINRLLLSTNKFKFVKLKPILLSVAKDREPMPRAICLMKKPNFSCSLRK